MPYKCTNPDCNFMTTVSYEAEIHENDRHQTYWDSGVDD